MNTISMNLFCLLEWFVPEKGLEIMFKGQVLFGCPSKTESLNSRFVGLMWLHLKDPKVEKQLAESLYRDEPPPAAH